jgi:hypothetical protein
MTLPLVEHLHLERVTNVTDEDPSAAGPAVLERVRQGLLDDSIYRELKSRRECPRLDPQVEIDFKAGPT